MSAPLFQTVDYLAALQALLPRGAAWPRDAGSTQTKLLAGFVPSFYRSNLAANRLLVDVFPATAIDLLPEWESALGLPDLIGAPPSTLSGRQAAVVDAFADTGGQSIPYFIALAARLGVTVTIATYRPHTVQDSVVAPIFSDEWAFTWEVTAPLSAGAPYGSTPGVAQRTPGFGNEALESVFAAYKPASTICITRYV